MARFRQYLDTDVLTEAKKRLHHIFDIFDSVAVMFSGGKDSLVVLHLTHEVMQERGMAEPVNVVFRDEELIPDEVVNFVDEYRQKDWVNMTWFTVPLASSKYVMGVSRAYVQWDPTRPWVRQKPAWGVSLPDGDPRVFDQYTMDAFAAERFTGKIAFLTGIRSAESLVRFRASVNKLNENYINASSAKNVSLCKPIYDWEENDVFRFFYDRGIKYCSIYDLQMWAGRAMRVSTPLHAEQAKIFNLTRSTTPDFYQRIVSVFPEMLAHERYFKEIDRAALQQQYGQSYDGVLEWIEENITDPKQLELAVNRYDHVMIRAGKDPDLYPPRYLLSVFMAGGYKREILPQGRRKETKSARQGE